MSDVLNLWRLACGGAAVALRRHAEDRLLRAHKAGDAAGVALMSVAVRAFERASETAEARSRSGGVSSAVREAVERAGAGAPCSTACAGAACEVPDVARVDPAGPARFDEVCVRLARAIGAATETVTEACEAAGVSMDRVDLVRFSRMGDSVAWLTLRCVVLVVSMDGRGDIRVAGEVMPRGATPEAIARHAVRRMREATRGA